MTKSHLLWMILKVECGIRFYKLRLERIFNEKNIYILDCVLQG